MVYISIIITITDSPHSSSTHQILQKSTPTISSPLHPHLSSFLSLISSPLIPLLFTHHHSQTTPNPIFPLIFIRKNHSITFLISNHPGSIKPPKITQNRISTIYHQKSSHNHPTTNPLNNPNPIPQYLPNPLTQTLYYKLNYKLTLNTSPTTLQNSILF